MVSSRSKALRIALGIGAAACLIAAFAIAGLSAWQPWVFFIGPDLAILAGVGRGLQKGQLHPRAVPLYNAVHVIFGPLALALASVWLGRPWLAAALAWAAHVQMDRGVGYELRTREGFIRGQPSTTAVDNRGPASA